MPSGQNFKCAARVGKPYCLGPSVSPPVDLRCITTQPGFFWDRTDPRCKLDKSWSKIPKQLSAGIPKQKSWYSGEGSAGEPACWGGNLGGVSPCFVSVVFHFIYIYIYIYV